MIPSVSCGTSASRVAKKARPSSDMNGPPWLACTLAVGGAPLGLQEAHRIASGRGVVRVHLPEAVVVVAGQARRGEEGAHAGRLGEIWMRLIFVPGSSVATRWTWPFR